MKAVVQRVSEARVVVAGETVGEIGRGLLVLAAVEEGDGGRERDYTADKLANLRIFPDAEGKMNLSVSDLGAAGGESGDGGAGILMVSNFTVAGSTRKGRRPSFAGAMKPPEAERAFGELVEAVRVAAGEGVRVETGAFGADMRVELVNDGPVTIVIDSSERGLHRAG